jgi:hypothetical protein
LPSLGNCLFHSELGDAAGQQEKRNRLGTRHKISSAKKEEGSQQMRAFSMLKEKFSFLDRIIQRG